MKNQLGREKKYFCIRHVSDFTVTTDLYLRQTCNCSFLTEHSISRHRKDSETEKYYANASPIIHRILRLDISLGPIGEESACLY